MIAIDASRGFRRRAAHAANRFDADRAAVAVRRAEGSVSANGEPVARSRTAVDPD